MKKGAYEWYKAELKAQEASSPPGSNLGTRKQVSETLALNNQRICFEQTDFWYSAYTLSLSKVSKLMKRQRKKCAKFICLHQRLFPRYLTKLLNVFCGRMLLTLILFPT